MINCKNYDIDDMQKIIILNQDLKSLSLSHTHTHTHLMIIHFLTIYQKMLYMEI